MAVLRLMPSQGTPTPVEISQDSVVVGREPTCDLVVSDGSVSRKHAIIEKRGTGWAIVDQGSANGTFVDSQRVTDVALHSGQELRFGAMAYRVEIEMEGEGATILTSAPDATVIQEAVGKKPAPPPSSPTPPPTPPKPAPPWSAPPRAPVVMPAPPLPTPGVPPPPLPGRAVGTPPPLPKAPAAPPPLPPRATAPPPPPPAGAAGPPPLPPRASAPRSSVVTPVSAGGPPAGKKPRGPLFWVGGGCCGCLVLVLVFLGVVGGGAFYMTSAAVDAARAQIADVKKGDLPAAYGRMSEEYRAQHSMEDFAAFVDRHPSLKENTDSTFTSRNVQNNTATIGGSLTGAPGSTEKVVYTLIKEGGGWKISSIEFGDEAPAEPGSGSQGVRDDAAPGGGGALRLETLAAETTADPPGHAVAIKLRATGFGTTGTGEGTRADLVLDLETKGPGGKRLPDLSRMELQARDRPDGLSPPHMDFDVNVTLRDATAGEYVARLTVRDQIGRDIKTQDVTFTVP